MNVSRRSLLKTSLGLTTAAVVGAPLLSACSGGSVTGNSSGDSSGKTQLTMWWSYTADSAVAAQKLVDEYNNSQSKVTITAQFAAASDQFDSKLINAIKNKQGPDIVLGDGTPQTTAQVVATGSVVQLDSYLESSKTLKKSNFTEGMLSTGTFNGKVYTLPTDIGDYAFVYNKQMFKDAGITDTPTTWAELVEDAKKLTKGTSQYGIYLPISSGEWPVFTWQSMLWGNGGEFLNAENTKVLFNSDAGVQALTAWVDLIKSGVAYPQSLFSSTNNGGTAALTAKKVAIAYDGAYNLSILDSALGKENVGVFAVPGIKTPAMNLGTDNSYILKSTAEKEAAAWAFLEHWLSPAVHAKWCIQSSYFPANQETSSDPTWKKFMADNPRTAVFVSELKYAKARPSITAYGQISDAVSQALTSAMMQKSTPKAALDQAAKTAQAVLDKG